MRGAVMNTASFISKKSPATKSAGPSRWVIAAPEQTRRIKGKGTKMNNSRSSVSRKFQSRGGNSRSPVGNVLPREKFESDAVAKGQAEVLQGVFGRLKSPAKEMAAATGLNERACRNQIAGLNSMNLADFFNACQTVPELRAWGARMMGLLAEGNPSFPEEFSKGRQEIVLRIDTGGLTLGKPGKE